MLVAGRTRAASTAAGPGLLILLWTSMPTEPETSRALCMDGENDISLLEILDHVLNSGVVIHGSLVISLAGVDLGYLGLNMVLTSVETALTNLKAEEKRSLR